MKRKKILFVGIIVVLIIFMLVGSSCQRKAVVSVKEKAEEQTQILQVEEEAVLPAVVEEEEPPKNQDEEETPVVEEEIMGTISIAEGKEYNLGQKEISFEEIKVGDNAFISLTLKPDYTIEGTEVRVSPADLIPAE